MQPWHDPESVTVPDALQAYVGGHPLVAETLVRRGITSVEAARAFLDPDIYEPTPPDALPDLLKAAERIEAAIDRGEHILVWGDFDVDGQTSTSLLVATLRDLGADVGYHIPVRATESHGIQVPYLKTELEVGVDVVLTCDTGVSEHEAVAYANAQDVDVVITDHHELPEDPLPEAVAVVNPHRLPEDHALATLPGVGVAYKLAEALYARAGRPDDVEAHLDLVALGIVADVATQTGETRYLLQRGMEALRNTKRVGLQALMRKARIQPAELNTGHIGFGLGPRLNALGRLDDANVIVDFLTTDDLAQARIVAAQLERLNTQRQRLCDAVEAGAEAQLARDPALLEPAALVLANPNWHPGVIGIVASRLVERYNRPTVLFQAPEGGTARGSARSIEGCHIRDAIATQAHLLEGFGGHAGAAGLALPAERVEAFRVGLSRAVREQVGEQPPRPPLQIAGTVPLAALSLALVDDFERLAPFGEGNPLPVLATSGLVVERYAKIGRKQNHLKVRVTDAEGNERPVLFWRAAPEDLPAGRFDLAYTARANTFRGERQLQLTWQDARPVVAPEVAAPEPEGVDISDYRREPHPKTLWQPLLDAEGVVVWAEADHRKLGVTREALDAADHLVIWTAPPGPEVLEAARAKVNPQTITLFFVDPGLDTASTFVPRLAGLVKYALNHRGGRVDVAALAAAMAHREITVRKGVAWLVARGDVTVVRRDADEIELQQGRGEPDLARAADIAADLTALLMETAAYRKHLRRADVEALWGRE
jgi:single-stranded-DNA-specific exonuclease